MLSAVSNNFNSNAIQEPILTPSSIAKDIAKSALLEFAISLLLTGISYCFIATPAAAATLGIGLAIQTIVSLAIRIYIGYCNYHQQTLPAQEAPPLEEKWLGAYSFAWGSAHNAQVVVHEAGHALAAKALLQGVNTKITLLPYNGGVTNIQWKGVSWLGEKIGHERIQPLISAAGPLLTLALSTVLLGVGLAHLDTSPEISRMLIVSALIDFVTHILYALSALTSNLTRFSHDFFALWQLGNIHPIVAAVAIAAIPVLVLYAHLYRIT